MPLLRKPFAAFHVLPQMNGDVLVLMSISLVRLLTHGVQAWAKAQPEYYEAVRSKIPLGRFGDIEQDIGRVAVFLASDDSQYITGQTIMVDGGSLMLH